MTPKPGDIGLVRGKGFAMWLVRLGTRSPYGHAFLVTGDGTIVEAQPRGARRTELHYRDVYWCTALSDGLSDVQRSQIAVWAVAHVGTPYSWIDDAEIGFVSLFGWAPKWMRRRLASDRTLMCSQLCVAAYRAAGVELFPGKPDGGESPGDLWRLNEKLKAAA